MPDVPIARLAVYRAASEPVYAGGSATKQFRDNVAVSDAPTVQECRATMSTPVPEPSSEGWPSPRLFDIGSFEHIYSPKSWRLLLQAVATRPQL